MRVQQPFAAAMATILFDASSLSKWRTQQAMLHDGRERIKGENFHDNFDKKEQHVKEIGKYVRLSSIRMKWDEVG